MMSAFLRVVVFVAGLFSLTACGSFLDLSQHSPSPAPIVDFKPALTYHWTTDDGLWNLGGQASGIVHMGTNHGWAYGNSIHSIGASPAGGLTSRAKRAVTSMGWLWAWPGGPSG